MADDLEGEDDDWLDGHEECESEADELRNRFDVALGIAWKWHDSVHHGSFRWCDIGPCRELTREFGVS